MFEVPKTSQPQMYLRPKSKSRPQDSNLPSNDYYKSVLPKAPLNIVKTFSGTSGRNIQTEANVRDDSISSAGVLSAGVASASALVGIANASITECSAFKKQTRAK